MCSHLQDPDRCIDALVAMGVLVPGGDRVAIRRTAVFFLNSFQVRARRSALRRRACTDLRAGHVLGVDSMCCARASVPWLGAHVCLLSTCTPARAAGQTRLKAVNAGRGGWDEKLGLVLPCVAL